MFSIMIQITPNSQTNHLLFADDVLIFCSGSRRDSTSVREILYLFSKATGMEINVNKSTLCTHRLSEEEIIDFRGSFPFLVIDIEAGLKYLDF